MRQHAKYFYVLFFIVIITFVFWGVGTNDKDQIRFVAEIGNERISVNEYDRAYRNTLDSYREIYKGKSIDEIEQQMNLKQRVLNMLIDEKVLLLSARELGVVVSDQELQQTIVSNPVFIRDGVFRKDIYQKALANIRLTPEGYETSLRRGLTADRMRTLIAAGIDVTDADLAGYKGDAAKEGIMRQITLLGKRNAAVKSYTDAARERFKVKINAELISS
jgi:hypothetical protein